MSQPAKAQEPSMEEILASIRRIISDDDGKPAAEPSAPAPPSVQPVPAADPPAAEAPADDILDLTEAMTAAPASTTAPAPAQPRAEFRTIDGQPDVVFEESQETSRLDAVAAAREQVAQNLNDRSLLSASTSAAVDAAFNTLAHTVLVQNARTLEDLVKEMLRPMLRAWLDDNLPPLVERLVRAEIERVSRGRG